MSFDHAGLMTYLELQLDRGFFSVRLNHGRLRQGDRTYDIPGVIVIPAELAEPLRGKPAALEIDVEIWSPSTGDCDVDAEFSARMVRGDLAIWRIHPYERTLTAWRRQAGGTYAIQVYRWGTAQPATPPNVTIDLAALTRRAQRVPGAWVKELWHALPASQRLRARSEQSLVGWPLHRKELAKPGVPWPR